MSTNTSTEGETLTSFAARHGFTKQRAHVLKKRGLPLLESGRVNSADADTWIEKNVDKSRRHSPKADAGTSRDRKEAADAALKELELARRRGELVEAAAVDRAMFERARGDRDALLAWVASAAPALASELGTDAAATFSVLDRLIREHLERRADTPTEVNHDERD